MARPAGQICPTVTFELPEKVIRPIDWWIFELKDSFKLIHFARQDFLDLNY